MYLQKFMRFCQHIGRKLINTNRIENVASKITTKETDRGSEREREKRTEREKERERKAHLMSDTFFHELYGLRLN
jgi:hypothetical protein